MIKFQYAEFNEMVDAAALRLVGLSEDKAADLMVSIVAAYELVVRKGTPEISDEDVESLRGIFMGNILYRLQEIGVQSGGEVGSA